MAYQLAQAYVQIVPSMKGVGKAIESAFYGPSKSVGQKAGDAAGGGFSKGFGAKLGIVSGIASSVATKVIGVFSGLSGQILDASDSTQKFAQTLDFAGVSEQQIKRLTASTQDYADKTVYDLNDIRNTTAQLAANGVPNYDRLAEAAGNLNAVAGGSADTFKSVAMVLTQTAGQGKLTTENWNQLSDAIPGASGKIQQALKEAGAYTGNFRDAMADGQITAQEFNDAIMSLGFTDAAVEAATSASTIEGATGNLEAAFVKLGASVLDSVKPAITGGMSWIADGVTNAVPVVQAGIEGLIGWFQRLYSKLEENGAITAFKSAWDTIRDAIMGVVNMVIDWVKLMPPDGVATAIKLIADTLNLIVGNAGKLAPVLIPAVAAFLGFKTATAGITAVAGGLDGIFNAAVKVKNAANGVTDLVNGIGGISGRISGRIQKIAASTKIAQNAQLAWNAVTSAGTAIQRAFNAVLKANPVGFWVTIFATVVAAFVWFFTQTEVGRKAWAAFTSFVSSAWQKTVDAVTSLGQNIANFFTQTLPNAFQSVVQWFQRLPERIGSALSNLLTAVGEWATCLAQSAWTAGNQFVQNVVYFITHLPETIAYWLSYSITFVVAWVALMGQKAIDAGTQFVQNAGTFISQLPGNIWNWLVATVTNTANWVAQMAGKASEAGSQFLNNMATFISQLPGRIWAFLVNVLTGAANWAGQMASNAAQAGSSFIRNVIQFVSQLPGCIAAYLRGVISNVGAFAGQMGQGALNAGRQFLSNIVNTLASIPGRVVSIGRNIVEGIVSGIMGSMGRVGSAILGGMNAAIANVKRMLGIHSPSRLFRDQIGMMMGLGLANGIDASARYVNASMGSMIGGLMPDINDLLPANRTYDAATMNRRMVYTPSTDAMQPQAGASNVNITNYYPQADPWPLATNDSLDKLTVGI